MAPPVRAAVTGLASYLPAGQLTNEMIVAEFGDWTAEKIASKTGIRSRHVVEPGEFTSDLAVRAAEALFAQDPRHREGIDMMLLTTVTPDYIVPVTAGIVQHRLGLPTTTGALDVTLGCSGYVYGMTLAASLIESGRARKVLLLTADRYSGNTEGAKQQVRTIIGDGSSATLVEAERDGDGAGAEPAGNARIHARIGAICLGTDGSGGPHLMMPTSGAKGWAGAETSPVDHPVFEMNGAEVFDFTLRTVVPHIQGFLEGQGLGVPDIDLYVFHQANLFMLEHMRRRLAIRDDQFVVRIEDVGNTVSTSIPLALETALEQGRVHPGGKILLVGFGTGYSWGSVLLEVQA